VTDGGVTDGVVRNGAAPGGGATGPETGSLRRLASLLVLQRKARQSRSVAEIGFLLVNDSVTVAPYRNAALWLGRRVEALSGVPVPDRAGAYPQWLARLCRHLATDPGTEARVVGAGDVPQRLRAEWSAHFPAAVLWLPLRGARGRRIGGLLLGRDESWDEADRRLLEHWAETASLALDALRLDRRWLARGALREGVGRRVLMVAAAGLVVALGFLPVNLTVQAPAEIVPREALVVRSPLNGIVDDVAVTPNAPVKAGDRLVAFDDREIRAKLDVVRHGLEVAQAEYRLAQQSAITSREAQGTLTLLRERIEQRRSEVQQAEALLERIVVLSDRDGIALIADAEALKGRPLRIGERLLTVADPAKAEIELWIATADSIALPEGAEVELYLNVEPGKPRPATLAYVSYQAALSPAGVLAFRAVARFADAPPPRIGLRGTAKIHGEPVLLAYYLFRRPLTVLRELTGF